MFIAEVDSHPVRLRASHDLTFLTQWGRVFRVLDDQDSGNLCFGVAGDQGKVFVKYAGAPTLRFDGEPTDAVKSLRAAATVHRDLAHPALVRLREAVDVGTGHALVFDWTDAIPMGRQYDRRSEALAGATVADRAAAVATLIDFHMHAAARGWVAVDLYDGSVMRDPATGLVLLCDLDAYERAPYVNPVGRMWGSARFMSPEEYQLGATIDERTTVFTLGALAHAFLGDDAGKARADWIGTDAQFAVAARAMSPDPSERWPSVKALAQAWTDAA